MIKTSKNHPLSKLNTFGVDAIAESYVQVDDINELSDFFLSVKPRKYLTIGEGSNLLFADDYKGTIIHPVMKGIKVESMDDQFVNIVANSGENWDSFVEYCCNHNYAGLENLSLIPGSIGSAPVQNIGAYGVEVKDHLNWVEGFDVKSGEIKKIYAAECKFGYRTSIFKEKLKGSFIITSVSFRLLRYPKFVLNYGNVEQVFKKKKKQDLQSLRECIIEIRRSKLPEPEEFGNAGSFFKNPVIPIAEFAKLQEDYPAIPSYPSGEMIKIPAAWLIEKAGWKGVKEKNIGTWPRQPLVIVNYGGAKGIDIFNFSEKIRKAVEEKFKINLEREVTVI
ncbi:MAG: UDP-N-acetylmuramate dehydrogenase [Bacteroidales bacterium]